MTLPATASASAATQQEPSNPKDQADGLLERFTAHLQNGEYREALNVAVALEKTAPTNDARAIAKTMRGSALLGLKKNQEAEALFVEADKLAPQLPPVSTMQMSTALWFENNALALAVLDRMIARMPDVVREMEPQLVYEVLRIAPEGDKTRNDDRKIALARLGFAAQYGDGMAADAVEVLVVRGDLRAAAEMLQFVDEPDKIQGLLALKRFAAFWPLLEAHAGPNLSKVIRSNVESAAREHASDPEDWVKFANYGEALRLAGRASEAAALQSNLPATAEAIARIDEKGGWAMNNIAYALRAAGRLDDADRLYASLNTAAIPNGEWRVNMIINRVAMLVDGGQFERAVPLLAGAEKSAKTDGNAYAQQLVRTIQFCTYQRTGRTAEAARVRPEMLKFADKARGATVDKLVCAGDLEQAEKLALEGLSDEDYQMTFVRSLQRRPLVDQDPVAWDTSWKAFRERPAISNEFERLGRDLPDHLRRLN